MEALSGKTVLLVTHQVDFLPAFHCCLVSPHLKMLVELSSSKAGYSLSLETVCAVKTNKRSYVMYATHGMRKSKPLSDSPKWIASPLKYNPFYRKQVYM